MTTLPDFEALYRLEARVHQRSAGRSAVAAAAYRAAARLIDDRTGRTYDYSRKAVVESWISAPVGAPAWTQDRQQLWDRVEASERRRDAVLARELILSIPRDLPPERRRALVEDVIRPLLAAGAVVDCAIHCPIAADGDEQPHAHIMMTLRALDESTASGFAARKNAELESLFESGGRRGGNRGEALKTMRARVAETINTHLASAKSSRRVDARSLRQRGLRRSPEPKMNEQRIAAVKRSRRHDRRTKYVHMLREARLMEVELTKVEGQMSQQKHGFTRLPQHRTDYKMDLLLQRYPGLDLSAHASSLYMVDVRRHDQTRVLMRDGGWMEVQGRRIQTWGTGDSADALARDIASLIGSDGGVERLERVAAIGRDADARPVVIAEGPAIALADRWRERGYTDVSESPDGCWVHLGPESRLRDTGDHVAVFGQISDDAVRALVEKAKDEWNSTLESHGPADFRERLWIECQRQHVEVIGYEPTESLRTRWGAEQAKIAAEADTLASVRRVTGDADLLLAAARGDVESLSKLDPELRTFVARYLDDEQRSHLARQSASDVVSELSRFRAYGRQEIEKDPDAAATVQRPTEPARERDRERQPV